MSRIAYLEDAQERDVPRRIAQKRYAPLPEAASAAGERSETAGWTPEMKATLARKLAAASPETRAFVARYMAENRA